MARLKLIEAEIMTVARTDKGTAVLIKPKNAEKVVPIFIGQLEAHAILIGLGNVQMPRPMTHDLFLSIFSKLKLSFHKVEIIDLSDGTFFANLILYQGVKKLSFDCRPSDALAIVARENIPLFINTKIIEDAGIPISMISEDLNLESADSPNLEATTDLSIELLNLEIKLNQALEIEDYEEAAKIRDELSKLDAKNEA